MPPSEAHTALKADSANLPRDVLRRAQLIDAATRSIAQHGLSRTTVARVAKIAGLSTGIVSFYFQTKDALLLATLEHVDEQYMQRHREAMRAAGEDPLRRLEAMIDAAFDPEICHPNRVAVWSAFWGEAGSRADYMRVCAAREAELEEQTVSAFRAVAGAGDYAHLEPEALGRAFHHLLSSLPESMLGADDPFDLERARAMCRGFLRSVFPLEFPAQSHGRVGGGPDSPKTDARLDTPFATLPTWVYHDAEFYELEKEAIFTRRWLLVGHASQLNRAGDYISLEVIGERIFVIRGKDGQLRAFDNVCRHRAAPLVTGEAGHCSGLIVCPYHGWRYGFDGGLQGVPAERSFADLDKSQIRLPALQLEEWMGFIYIRFSGAGPSVSQLMKSNEEEAGLYRFEQMKPLGQRSVVDCDFNWKLFSENDSEGYHIPVGHPGLRRLFGNSYSEELEGGEGSQAHSVLQEKESPVWAERAYQRLLPEVDHLPAHLKRAWIYYGIFPASVLQISPDMVDCYQVLPTGPESSQLISFRMALPDDRREMKAARYLSGRIVRNVVREDIAFCRWTNQGVQSRRYDGGHLSGLESGVQIFQDKIRELIPVAKIRERPPRGDVTAVNARLRGGNTPKQTPDPSA